VMVQPQPKAPEPPNISFRFSGEDLVNPAVVALLSKGGYMPTPEEVEAAKKLVASASTGMAPTGPAVPPAAPSPEPSHDDITDDPYPDWTLANRLAARG